MAEPVAQQLPAAQATLQALLPHKDQMEALDQPLRLTTALAAVAARPQLVQREQLQLVETAALVLLLAFLAAALHMPVAAVAEHIPAALKVWVVLAAEAVQEIPLLLVLLTQVAEAGVERKCRQLTAQQAAPV